MSSEAPEARTRCVMVLGQLCDETIFASQVPQLGKHVEVDVQRVTSASVAEAVESVLDNTSGPIALVGFSLGGIVALSCAIRAPDRISHLALIGTNPHSPRPEQLDLWQRWRNLVSMGRFDDVVDEIVQSMLRPGVDDRFRLRVRAMAQAVGPEELVSQLKLQQSRTSLVPDLGYVTARTLVVGGERDPLCPPEFQTAIHSGIRAAELRIEPGAGHLLPWERAEEMASSVIDLLKIRTGEEGGLLDAN